MRRSIPVYVVVTLILGGMAALLVGLLSLHKFETNHLSKLAELERHRFEAGRFSSLLHDHIDQLNRQAYLLAATGKDQYARSYADSILAIQALRKGNPLPAKVPMTAADQLLLQESFLAIEALMSSQLKALEVIVTNKPSAQALLNLAGPQVQGLQQELGLALNEFSTSLLERLAQHSDALIARTAALRNNQIALMAALGMVMLLSFGIVHSLGVRPLRQILDAAARIGGGDYSFRAQTYGLREIENLSAMLNWMADSFQSDMEVRAEAERSAQAVERRLRELSDLAPGVIWETRYNPHTGPEVSYSSQAFEDFYAVDRDKVSRDFRMIFQAIHPDDCEDFAATVERAIAERSDLSSEHRSLRKDGSYRWVRAYGRVSELADGTLTWNGYSVDVHELTELKGQLENALSLAEAANRTKSEFIANVSHEIRTPMNAVLGMTHLCLQTELSLKQREYLQKIENSARLLLRIINNVLDSSKIEAGRLELEHIDFSLDQVLENVSDVVALKAREKNLEFLFDVPADVPRALLGDALRLGQVLTNLAGNAVKFTDEGEVRVSVRSSGRRDNAVTLKFEVADTGIGIDPDQLPYLFDSFTQADTSTTRRFGGTGLGLSICRQLVQLLGGEIVVESTPGQGSIFSFSAEFGLHEAGQTALRKTANALGQLQCLVVDDSRSARRIMVSTLRSFGFDADDAASGEEALRLIQERPYDFVLVDWRMPGMDGVETARHLRNTAAPDTRIVLVTAYGRDEVLDEVEHDRLVDALLLKPISASVLLDTIAASFGNAFEGGHRPLTAAPLVLPDLKQTRLLLAEDSEISRELTVELLEAAGATVVAVGDGEAALAAAGQDPFDAILLDLHMPRMGGLDAAQAIRNELGDEITPILAMTADTMSGSRERAMQAGMNDYIEKPLDVAKMYATVARWVEAPAGSSIPAPRSPNLDPQRSKLPGVDVRDGLARANNNAELYFRLLAKLVQRHEDLQYRVQSAIDHEDWQALEAMAHSLRGAAANLGAHRIAELSGALESAARSRARETGESLALDLDATIQALQQALALPADPPGPQRRPLHADELQRLRALIEAGDTAARQLVAELRPQADEREILDRLEAHLGRYEFEKALSLLIQLDKAQCG